MSRELSRHLFACGGVALWAAKISQPCTAVEFTIGGLDLVWLGAVRGWLNDQSIETLNLLGTWVGDPSDDDGVASVPCVEDGEWNIWLRTLAGDEKRLGSEGERAERNWACCAAVNQGVDGVRLVGVVGCEDILGQGNGVVGDQLSEVVSDDICVRVAQAECITGLSPAVCSCGGAGEEGSRNGENRRGTHID